MAHPPILPVARRAVLLTKKRKVERKNRTSRMNRKLKLLLPLRPPKRKKGVHPAAKTRTKSNQKSTQRRKREKKESKAKKQLTWPRKHQRKLLAKAWVMI